MQKLLQISAIALLFPLVSCKEKAMSLIEAHVIEAVAGDDPQAVESAQLAMFWARLAIICGEADDELKIPDLWEDPRIEEVANLKERAEKAKTAEKDEAQKLLNMQTLAQDAAEAYAEVLRDHKGGEKFAKRIDTLIESRK